MFRSREYLTEPEIEKLRKAARKNRNPVRDELLILLAFRHALRVSELVGLTVEQFDLKAAAVHIRRAVRSKAPLCPLYGLGPIADFSHAPRRALGRLTDALPG